MDARLESLQDVPGWRAFAIWSSCNTECNKSEFVSCELTVKDNMSIQMQLYTSCAKIKIHHDRP